jgi:hypothetical protein
MASEAKPSAFELAWASACDATGCSEAVCKEGWELVLQLQKLKDGLDDVR